MSNDRQTIDSIRTGNTFDHGPKAKREARLLTMLRWVVAINALLILSLAVIAAAAILKPDRIVMVDRQTGKLLGEYRSTAHRSPEELVGGAKRFADYFLSMNSATVYQDYENALKMMTPELATARIEYLKSSNLARDVQAANCKAHLEFDETRLKPTNKTDPHAKVELAGQIVIDTNTIANSKKGDDQVTVTRRRVPFRMVVDLEMVNVSSQNTAGLQVIDYYEYD